MFIRAFIVWLIIIAVETVNGIIRNGLIAPAIGDFRSRQIGVFIGIVLIFAIALTFVRWIGDASTASLFVVGVMWVTLTVAFELFVGFVMGLSRERILEDYDIVNGGLMPFGLLCLLFTPIAASFVRRKVAA